MAPEPLKPLLDYERAVDATLVTDARIAPDGARVVYVTEPASQAGERPCSALWLVAADGGAPRRLTTATTREHTPRWSPNSRHVAFLSDREQPGVGQLYVIALDGGEAVKLTAAPSGVNALDWSPDGMRLAFTARDVETDAQRAERDARGGARVVDVDEQLTGLWVLDVPADPNTLDAPPAARRVSPEGFHVGAYTDAGFAWAPDGAGFVVVGGRSATTNARIRSEMFTLSLSGELRSLGRVEGLTASPRFSPDGSTLAFIAAEDVIPARWVLQTMPARGGPRHIVAPGYPATFQSFAWLPDGGRLFTRIEVGQRHEHLVVDLEAGAPAPAWDALALPGDSGFSDGAVSVSSDGTRCAFVRASDASIGDVYVAELGGTARKLTDLNPWTRDYAWGETREVRWTSFDELEIEGLLILPVGYRAGQRYPTLLHIHGGPAYAWTRHLYANWHDWGQFLAQRGFAVLMPNPRGSTGRGTDFLRQIAGRYGEPDFLDLMAGVDWLIAQGIADSDRLVVGGWSGGGYLTNWTITHTDRFKAAIAGAGPSNWLSYLGTADIRAVFERYVGAPHEDPEPAWRLSPVRSVVNANTPTLFLHGEADDRVPIGQAYEMYAGLKARGVETQLVVYPREPHGFGERKHQVDLLRRVVAWYEGHLP